MVMLEIHKSSIGAILFSLWYRMEIVQVVEIEIFILHVALEGQVLKINWIQV